MIRIKDYMFNEKDIRYIQEYDFDEYTQISICTKEQEFIKVNNATFEDIEWNYENNNEYCNVFYEDRIKELEEKNKTFEDYNKDLNNQLDKLEEENKKLKEENQHIFANVNDDELLRSNAMNWAEKNELQDRINKAINYIEEHSLNYNGECEIDLEVEECKDLIKILKGEENEK